jgi:hypothetical protein
MSIPIPALLAIIALLGWPFLQLRSVLAAKGPRQRLKAVADALRADPRFGEMDRKLLDVTLEDAKWHWATSFVPLKMPFLMSDKISETENKKAQLEYRSSQLGIDVKGLPIWSDERYQRLAEQASNIVVVRSPITVFMALVVFILFSPLYFRRSRARKEPRTSPIQIIRMNAHHRGWVARV